MSLTKYLRTCWLLIFSLLLILIIIGEFDAWIRLRERTNWNCDSEYAEIIKHLDQITDVTLKKSLCLTLLHPSYLSQMWARPRELFALNPSGEDDKTPSNAQSRQEYTMNSALNMNSSKNEELAFWKRLREKLSKLNPETTTDVSTLPKMEFTPECLQINPPFAGLVPEGVASAEGILDIWNQISANDSCQGLKPTNEKVSGSLQSDFSVAKLLETTYSSLIAAAKTDVLTWEKVLENVEKVVVSSTGEKSQTREEIFGNSKSKKLQNEAVLALASFAFVKWYEVDREKIPAIVMLFAKLLEQQKLLGSDENANSFDYVMSLIESEGLANEQTMSSWSRLREMNIASEEKTSAANQSSSVCEQVDESEKVTEPVLSVGLESKGEVYTRAREIFSVEFSECLQETCGKLSDQDFVAGFINCIQLARALDRDLEEEFKWVEVGVKDQNELISENKDKKSDKKQNLLSNKTKTDQEKITDNCILRIRTSVNTLFGIGSEKQIDMRETSSLEDSEPRAKVKKVQLDSEEQSRSSQFADQKIKWEHDQVVLAIASFAFIDWQKVDPELIPALVLFYARLVEHQRLLGKSGTEFEKYLVSETVSECNASESSELVASWLRLREMVEKPNHKSKASLESISVHEKLAQSEQNSCHISAIASEQKTEDFIRTREIFSEVFARCVEESRGKTGFEGSVAESFAEPKMGKCLESILENCFADLEAGELSVKKSTGTKSKISSQKRETDFDFEKELTSFEQKILAIASFGYINWSKVDPQLIPALVMFYAQLIEHQKLLGNKIPSESYIINEIASQCKGSESSKLLSAWNRLREMTEKPKPTSKVSNHMMSELDKLSKSDVNLGEILALACEQKPEDYIRTREIFAEVFPKCVEESGNISFEGCLAETFSKMKMGKCLESDLKNCFAQLLAQELEDQEPEVRKTDSISQDRSKNMFNFDDKMKYFEQSMLAIASFGYIDWHKVDPELIPSLVLFYARLVEHQKVIGYSVPADEYILSKIISECKANESDENISAWNRLREMTEKSRMTSKACEQFTNEHETMSVKEDNLNKILALAAQQKTEDYIRTREIFAEVFEKCGQESRISDFEGVLAETFKEQKLGHGLQTDLSRIYEFAMSEKLSTKNDDTVQVSTDPQEREDVFGSEKSTSVRQRVLAMASEAFIKWLQLDSAQAIPAVLMFYAQILIQNNTLPENPKDFEYFITKILSNCLGSDNAPKSWIRPREMPVEVPEKPSAENQLVPISEKLLGSNFSTKPITAFGLEKNLSEFSRPRELLSAIFEETLQEPCGVIRDSFLASVVKLNKLARALEMNIDFEKTWINVKDLNRKEALNGRNETRKLQKIDYVKNGSTNNAELSQDKNMIVARNALGVVKLEETHNKEFRVFNTKANKLPTPKSCHFTSKETIDRALAHGKNDKIDLFEAHKLNSQTRKGTKTFESLQDDNCTSESEKLISKVLAKAKSQGLILLQSEDEIDQKGANPNVEKAEEFSSEQNCVHATKKRYSEKILASCAVENLKLISLDDEIAIDDVRKCQTLSDLWTKEEYESDPSLMTKFLAFGKEANDIKYEKANEDELEVMEGAILPHEQQSLEAARTRKVRMANVPVEAMSKVTLRLIEVAQVIDKGTNFGIYSVLKGYWGLSHYSPP